MATTRGDRRPLAGLLVANAISIAGNAFTLFAIPLFVLETTGSATKTGIAAGVSTLPIVLSAAFSGTLADRVGHRVASIGSDLASAAIVIVLPVLHATVGVAYWQVLALIFLRSFLATPGETARGALLPDLTARAGTTLERATGAYDAVSRGARMVGFPVAGLLIALLGAPNMLVVDAATFVVSAALVYLLVPPPPPVERVRTRYLADLREGLGYMRQDATTRSVVLMCMATNMLDAGFGGVMLPFYAERVLDDRRALGLVVGVAGAAALAGALAFGAVGQRLPRRATFFVAFLLCGPPRFFVVASGARLAVLVAVTAMSGLFAGALNPIMDTAIFDRVPEHLRARVWGVVIAGSSAAIPVGGVLAGLSVEELGFTTTLVTFGTAYLLVTLTPLVGSSWSGLERRAAPAHVPEEPRHDVEVSTSALGDGGVFGIDP
ncbi:MAG TPA: MFS transporter [Mycobacteriales bacterium]